MIFEIKNLTGGYGGKIVLNKVSFSTQSGDMIYVLGPNGGGKTTLFNALTRLKEVFKYD